MKHTVYPLKIKGDKYLALKALCAQKEWRIMDGLSEAIDDLIVKHTQSVVAALTSTSQEIKDSLSKDSEQEEYKFHFPNKEAS